MARTTQTPPPGSGWEYNPVTRGWTRIVGFEAPTIEQARDRARFIRGKATIHKLQSGGYFVRTAEGELLKGSERTERADGAVVEKLSRRQKDQLYGRLAQEAPRYVNKGERLTYEKKAKLRAEAGVPQGPARGRRVTPEHQPGVQSHRTKQAGGWYHREFSMPLFHFFIPDEERKILEEAMLLTVPERRWENPNLWQLVDYDDPDLQELFREAASIIEGGDYPLPIDPAWIELQQFITSVLARHTGKSPLGGYIVAHLGAFNTGKGFLASGYVTGFMDSGVNDDEPDEEEHISFGQFHATIIPPQYLDEFPKQPFWLINPIAGKDLTAKGAVAAVQSYTLHWQTRRKES